MFGPLQRYILAINEPIPRFCTMPYYLPLPHVLLLQSHASASFYVHDDVAVCFFFFRSRLLHALLAFTEFRGSTHKDPHEHGLEISGESDCVRKAARERKGKGRKRKEGKGISDPNCAAVAAAEQLEECGYVQYRPRVRSAIPPPPLLRVVVTFQPRTSLPSEQTLKKRDDEDMNGNMNE